MPAQLQPWSVDLLESAFTVLATVQTGKGLVVPVPSVFL